MRQVKILSSDKSWQEEFLFAERVRRRAIGERLSCTFVMCVMKIVFCAFRTFRNLSLERRLLDQHSTKLGRRLHDISLQILLSNTVSLWATVAFEAKTNSAWAAQFAEVR